MCDPVTLAAIAVGGGLTVGVAGTIDAQNKSEKAARMQQAMESRKAQRSQLQALRESQIQRAMIQQRSAVGGSLDSSGFSGAMSSIGSQLGSNIGFSREMTSFGQGISSLQQQAARSKMISQLGFQAASLGMSGLGGAGGGTAAPATPPSAT